MEESVSPHVCSVNSPHGPKAKKTQEQERRDADLTSPAGTAPLYEEHVGWRACCCSYLWISHCGAGCMSTCLAFLQPVIKFSKGVLSVVTSEIENDKIKVVLWTHFNLKISILIRSLLYCSQYNKGRFHFKTQTK